MDPVTSLGGPGGAFPPTLWTVILSARDPDTPDAAGNLERLCGLYWKPVYWLVRLRWNRSNEDAKDLTQEFFATFLEKGFLQSVSPEKGRFRTFVRTALENFMRNVARDGHRLKRGGGRRVLSLDDPDSPLFDPPSQEESLERAFDRVWAQTLMQECLATLRRQYRESGRGETFAIFDAFDLVPESPSYAELAGRFRTTEDGVRGALRRVRADLKAFLRDRVLQSLRDPTDLDAEMAPLFGGANSDA